MANSWVSWPFSCIAGMKALSPSLTFLPPPFPKQAVGFISKPASSCYKSRSTPPGMTWTATPENYLEFTCTWLVGSLRPVGPCLPHHVWERCIGQFGQKNKTVWEIPPTQGTACNPFAVKEMVVNFSSWLLNCVAYSTLCRNLNMWCPQQCALHCAHRACHIPLSSVSLLQLATWSLQPFSGLSLFMFICPLPGAYQQCWALRHCLILPHLRSCWILHGLVHTSTPLAHLFFPIFYHWTRKVQCF